MQRNEQEIGKKKKKKKNVICDKIY
jgi:hypothetical protein